MSSTSADSPGPVTCSIDGAVATITLDDGKANALSHAMLDGFDRAIDEALDAKAGVLLVVGRDGKFSAGFDLSVMTAGPVQARDLLRKGADLALRLFELPIPVVFAVTGHALAMGGILLCCADVRIGASGPYKVGLPEVRIGMPVPAFAVELCRDRLSSRWFTRAVLLGERVDPQQALEAGFLDEIVELDQVRDRARSAAAEIAEQVGRGPFRVTRSTTRQALGAQLRELLDSDMEAFDVETQ
ncbi:MAG: crotonase/enoyl-CoA hydratase family protein [Microthrixaceae bacterium]